MIRRPLKRLSAIILLVVAFSGPSFEVIGTPAGSADALLDPASIYVLAFGSCPPWLSKIKVCRHDVQQFAEAARDVIGVPAGQITTLSNEEATASAVRAAFVKLRDSMPQGSTVIVYYVGHGMLVPKAGSGSAAEETFLLWSASFPFAALYALQAGIWLTGSELTGMVDSLPADSALVILDTCDASGADDAILAKRPHSPQVAVMASSRAHEIAFADLISAVFTRNLIEAMRSQSPTLYDAFQLAQKEAVAEAATRCEGAAASSSAGEDCTPQEPELVDPPGITKRIRLGK